VSAKKTKTAEGAKAVKSISTAKPSLVAVASEETHEETKITAITSLESAVTDVALLEAVPTEGQDTKWQEIRLILEKLKNDTLREIRKSVKNGTEAVAAIEPGGDIYDQASSERDRELGLLLGDREREKIHSIDEALLRIDDGEYGICEECDEDIPLGRLKAMPFTRHCVRCKSDLEKLQAQTKRVEEERAYREIPLGAEDEES
jgi:DnaK suppressor protein